MLSKQPSISAAALPSYTRGRSLDSTKSYHGSLLSFLATGADTAGRSALVEYRGRAGDELPACMHEWEHTTYFVLEGRLKFHCAGQVTVVEAGEMAFAPRGAPHGFRIHSPQVRLLLSVQAAGPHAVGFDEFLLAVAIPATSLQLPRQARAYTTDDPEFAVRLGAQYGIRILSPQELAGALPHYSESPGDGAGVDIDWCRNPANGLPETEAVCERQRINAAMAITSHETEF